MIGKYEVTQNEYKSIIGTNPNKKLPRVHPFRIIYRIEGDVIIVKKIDHRKQVYE
jgi:mRNA-degrading endonuclease RelE of RelBE toxin-antitoxin system